ncbi:MAG: hypothetical protein V3S64_04750, partial [bacterium]
LRIRRRLSGDFLPRWKEGEGEPVWIVDFEAKDGTLLTIEEWGDEASGDWEYDISLSRQIDPNDIGVLVEKAEPPPKTG